MLRLLDGAPGEIIGFLPVSSFNHPAGRPIITFSFKVLHRPVESAQFTSTEYAAVAQELGVRLSVGRTGSCHDNAVAESWFSMLKNEMYYRRRFTTRAQARFHVMQYIEVFYNRRRRHSTLGYRTPASVHADYHHQTATAA